jgi:uridine phosphorylase
VRTEETPPILAHKHYSAASAFRPENLLREARRQKGLSSAPVPEICILDPDGDMVRYLCNAGLADRHPSWACYHTDLYVYREGQNQYGILGCAVGAAFAVLVAEELFASGCQLLVSMTSSGQILPVHAPPYFVVIERALRDEGTSYHYLPPSDYSEAAAHLTQMAREALTAAGIPIQSGATWTTDAPFRETEEAIDAAKKAGILAVEMEAAALYAFAKARDCAVLCFAHVTNQMGRIEGDFEKGVADGAEESLKVIALAGASWKAKRNDNESL